MDLELAGCSAIVTGGSRGIGRAIALGLAREGVKVAICARSPDALEHARAEIAALGVTAFAQSVDVANATALSVFLDQARAALGGVDILVNNPSGFAGGNDEAAWRANLEVDLLATVRASEQVVPWLRARGGGVILHVASIAGMKGSATGSAYAGVKAAMISHAASLALRLAGDGIRVNAISPGSIDFPDGHWDRLKREGASAYRDTLAKIPSGRMGTPEEVADVAVFLASARARWVTGANIVVDGGQLQGLL